MSKEIKIPQISEGVDTATVAEILVAEGDSVEKDQDLITVESDKASVEIPATAAGKIKSIKISEGDEVNVGDVIMVLQADDDGEEDGKEEQEEKEDDKKKSSEKKEKKEEPEDTEDSDDEEEKSAGKKKKSADTEDEEQDSDDEDEEWEEDDDSTGSADEEDDDDSAQEKDDASTGSTTEKDSGKGKSKAEKDKPVPASPGVRKLARELGVDLTSVSGSGSKGRISDADVKAALKSGKKSQSIVSENLPDFNKWGDTETKPLSGIRKTTAKKVTYAWQEIPHVFQFDEADITDIQNYMNKNQEKAKKAGGKLTITAILTKISADALQRFPKFNASIDFENQQMILKKYINIGMAVSTEKGLMLPVIRDVDKKGMVDLSVEISELAEKARNGKLKAEEMEGGNFSISNLGGIGGTNFTPIIYAPQVAILGVSRSQVKPIYRNGQLEPREMLPLSLSYDHRLIDGSEAAEFITWFKQALEDPFKALLG